MLTPEKQKWVESLKVNELKEELKGRGVWECALHEHLLMHAAATFVTATICHVQALVALVHVLDPCTTLSLSFVRRPPYFRREGTAGPEAEGGSAVI